MNEIIIHPSTGQKALKVEDSYIPMMTYEEMESNGWFPVEIPASDGMGYYSDSGNCDGLGSQYLKFPHHTAIDFERADNFSIEFSFIFHPVFVSGYNYIFAKADSAQAFRGFYFAYYSPSKTFNFEARNSASNRYAIGWNFEIEYGVEYQIKVDFVNGVALLSIDEVQINGLVASNSLSQTIKNTSPLILLASPNLAIATNTIKGEIRNVLIKKDNTPVFHTDFSEDIFDTKWTVFDSINGNHGESVNMSLDNRRSRTYAMDRSKIKDISDIAIVRQQAIDFYFNGQGLPTALPVLVTNNFLGDNYLTISGFTNLDHVEIWKCQQPYFSSNLDVNMYLFIPINPNGKFILNPFGHCDDWAEVVALNYPQNIQDALNQGYTVGSWYMLGRATNGKAINTHNGFKAIDTPTFSALQYFLTPCAVFMNKAVQLGFTDIYMYGQSGGGWTTNIYAAIDTRIKISCENAGSMPEWISDSDRQFAMGARNGDYEQGYDSVNSSSYLFDFYRNVCGKFENYCLASDRKHIHILIKGDGVGAGVIGFQSEFSKLWKDQVIGNYEFISDDTTIGVHVSSQWAFNEFLNRI